MREIRGNAWLLAKDFDVLCITTNGMIKKNGECVMGRGIASQFKARFPFGPKILGDKITENGNIVQKIMWNDEIIYMAFPTKHKWLEGSNMELIKNSAKQLEEFALDNPDKKILLPKPGCSNGGLNWSDVKTIINFLPDNVYIVDF